MRVLVTGGAGFIGSHLVARGLASGMQVGVLDNFSTGKRENVPPGVAIFEVDLRDREATLRAVRAFAPEVVSHQAAQTSVPKSLEDPRLDAEVNILGGVHLLEACQASKVTKLVFASTGSAIYGEVSAGERASERYPARPKTPYGINKHAFESLLGALGPVRGLKTTILRYANVYGPRQSPRGDAGVVAIFFERARSGQPLQVCARRAEGDEGCIRDYTYVEDVIRANLAALTGDLPYGVMNVGSGEPTSTLALARQILALTGSCSPVVHGPTRQGDIECSVLDPSSFMATLGTPTPLAAGLAETARYYGKG